MVRTLAVKELKAKLKLLKQFIRAKSAGNVYRNFVNVSAYLQSYILETSFVYELIIHDFLHKSHTLYILIIPKSYLQYNSPSIIRGRFTL